MTTMGSAADPQEHATAARIEHSNPRWAIIWGTHSRMFWAFPRFTATPGTIITAPATTELLDGMREAELSASTLRRHP